MDIIPTISKRLIITMVMITKQQFNEILNSVRHLKFVSFRYLKFEGEGRFEFNGSFKIETLELAGLSYNNKDEVNDGLKYNYNNFVNYLVILSEYFYILSIVIY